MFLLTEWEGWTGKYLARCHGVWTERSEASCAMTESQIFSDRPSHLVNKYFIIQHTTFITLNFIGKILKGTFENVMKV